jgi:hypothetical protein
MRNGPRCNPRSRRCKIKCAICVRLDPRLVRAGRAARAVDPVDPEMGKARLAVLAIDRADRADLVVDQADPADRDRTMAPPRQSIKRCGIWSMR